MSGIKLFSITDKVLELTPSNVLLERDLQNLIERNMETFFGVRFLKSEYVITDGRIDSIGLDENNCPVILEYKRSMNENVINQGLFYLDWLLDHQGDFQVLVQNVLGVEEATKIDWSMPCVMCIASDFTRYDLHAVKQMQRNIKLIKYRKYGNEMILFEHLNAPVIKAATPAPTPPTSSPTVAKTHTEKLSSIPEATKDFYDRICSYIEALDDDFVCNTLKYYAAFKKTRNFACIEVHNRSVVIYLNLNPERVELENGFTRDVRNIGHFGTGSLQINVFDEQSYTKALLLIDKAYEEV